MSDRVVLVALDASENARAALGFARWLAQSSGSRLVAVHAVGLLEGAGLGPQHRALPEVGGPGEELMLCDGDPVGTVLTKADELDAIAIVLGRRGEGARGAEALGSTSAQVVERANRPVVMVPPTP